MQAAFLLPIICDPVLHTATELVAELKTVTNEIIYPNRVMRNLIQNGYEFSKYGIVVESKRTRKGRIIILHYNAERDRRKVKDTL